MGKKMLEKDGHKREDKQIEEGNSSKESDVLDVSKSSNRDGDKNKIEADNDEKKDRIKKRKAKFDTDKKAHKKRKKSKDVVEVKEIPMEACLGGIENAEQESKQKKNRDGSDSVVIMTETLEHGKRESHKAHKKHKKNKDVVEVKEISMETCLGGKKNTEQESIEAMNLENSEEAKRVRKDKHKKKKKNRDGIDAVATGTETPEHSKMQEPVEAQKICSPEDINKTVHGEEEAYEKRKKEKKQKLEKVNGNATGGIAVMSTIAGENYTGEENSAGTEIECRKLRDIGGDAENGNGRKKKKSKSVKNDSETETIEHSKMREPVEAQKICSLEDISKTVHEKEEVYEKQKRKKKKQKLDDIAVTSSIADENGSGKENSADDEIERRKSRDIGGDADDGNGCKKKKSKSVKNDSEGEHHKGDARTRSVDTTNQVENATPKEKSKKVSFSDQVEVFPSTGFTDDANKDGNEGLVYGKRYSKEEDEIVMNAVAKYIEDHNLGDDGLNMVLNCGVHKLKNCWKEIQAAIPWRPIQSVYHRAHVLFERDEKHPWTPEELETVRNFVEKHGPQWRLLADSLGKHRHHVKDAWRRIKLTNCNKGRWKQEEYQSLFDLVNLDLSMKASEERISKHGMLRDNICWTAISDRMQTRPFVSCCDKWYNKLTSPMVAQGMWADADDYRMLDALLSLDACCMEDVDWDNLLEHRSGDLCRKRWSQMVHHLGPNKDMSFSEQVDILANRYRPDMADVRATYDCKVPIDLP